MLRHTLAACAALVAGTTFSQGNFRVAEADLPAMKLNHYFTPDKRSHDADFEWTFTRTGFTIRKGPIPAHLTDMLLPAGVTGDEITGKWKLTPGSELELSDSKCGDQPGKQGAKLRAFKTAPTVVRVSDPAQFVFGIGS
jgi:hypothetical protein